jgi:FlaA1/EpsC-like NDP-sugar epimerase
MLLNFNSEISEFYKEKSIFLTGATGFLGKALIEKLLRSCSQVKTIYVLVRKKKGKSATERLYEIVDNQVTAFSVRISSQSPSFNEQYKCFLAV